MGEALVSKVQSYTKLERGWNSYGAPKIDERVIAVGMIVAATLPDTIWAVAPAGDGSVIFEHRADDSGPTIEIQPPA